MHRSGLQAILAVTLLSALPFLGAGAEERQAASDAVAEPSEEQILAAYAAALEALNTRSARELGSAQAAAVSLVLEDINKLGCRRLDRAGAHYDCRVERRIRRGGQRPATDVVQLWLSYEGEQWMAR